MATKTYSPNEQLPASVAGPIQQSIAKIQQGISSLGGGSATSVAPAINPRDLPGYVPGSLPGDRPSGGKPIPQTPNVSVATPELQPTDQAPQELANQVAQAQQGVNQIATSKGLTLQKTPTGGYSAIPDESALRKQAHQALTQSGEPASQSAGVGGAVTQSALGSFAPQKESPSILGPIQETDSMFDSLFTQYDEFFSPTTQRESLLSEYEKLSGSLGIETLNKELIDTKRIIDGTEDDIRSEITSAGGTATESQVMAMSNSRNKQLIKNYNYLLDTKNASTTQLTTMMNLSVQDRQFAEAEFTRKLNFGMQVAQFQQTATNNARSQFQFLITNGLGGALLTNPYETSLAEKTLGLPSGGLAQVVATQQQQQSLETRKTEAEIAKLEREGTGGGKPITSATALQLADAQAATKMLGGLKDTLESNTGLFGPFKGRLGGLNPYATQAQDVQSTINATKQIVGKFLEGGVLRKEDEAKYEKILPTLKDTPSVAERKLNNVFNLVNAKINAQQETLRSSGYNVNLPPSDQNVITGPDGNEYEITD